MAQLYHGRPFCGCWYGVPGLYHAEKKYLPQVDLASSTTILATTSRTTLSQTFMNPSNTGKLDEVQYTFPLYDGVTVVGFQCTIADRTIVGVVKEKQQARTDYKEAVERGETAGLMEQLLEASDVFTTKIGNVPANGKVVVQITYLGELKHDAETDGSRFTIPTFVAPRYGDKATDSAKAFQDQASDRGSIRILVDVVVEEGSLVRGLQSPSHPIAVTMGRTSSMNEDAFDNNHASATLTLGSTELDKDFVIVVLVKGQDTPRALLEAHSSIPNQRAIMTTLVPKFNLTNILPEIVFVVDRSGSMEGKIKLLVSALNIFLKSLPVGVKFNICSFGSRTSFLFPRSRLYDESSLRQALSHVSTFAANYGGTEMLQPIKETVENRLKDMALEVMLLTDGEIWNQQELFDFINESVKESDVRFFSLGVGSGASSSLVEGIARAGDGFAQFVGENENMDKRVVRMLKGALTPHIKDYTLELKYAREDDAMDDEFEFVESVSDSLKVVVTDLTRKSSPKRKAISLFDPTAKEEPTNPSVGRYDHLPTITTPKILQAPHKIPSLYPFNRTSVYLLISGEASRQAPKAVVLRATSEQGPLELEIPIQDIGHGQTLHQLAAKKAVHEIEQGRGWLTEAKNGEGKLIKDKFEGRWDEMVEREAARLGVQFQVGGKWCSFVAVEKHANDTGGEHDSEAGWQMQTGSDEAGVGDAAFSPMPGRNLFGALSQPSGNVSFGRSLASSTTAVPSRKYRSRILTSGTSANRRFDQVRSGASTTTYSGGCFGTPAMASCNSGVLCASPSNDTSSTLFGGQAMDNRSSPPGLESDNTHDPISSEPSQNVSAASKDRESIFGANSSTQADSSALTGSGFNSGPWRARKSVLPMMAMAAPMGFGASQVSLSNDSLRDHPVELMTLQQQPQSGKKLASMAARSVVEPKRGMKMATRAARKVAPLTGAQPTEERTDWPASQAAPDPIESLDTAGELCEDDGPSTGEVKSDHPAKDYTMLSNEDKMHEIIGLQGFDGSWEMNETLLNISGVERARVDNVFAKGFTARLGDDGIRIKIMATIVAVAWLEVIVKGEEDVWEMVVEKAKAWLAKQDGSDFEADLLTAKKALFGV